MFVPIWLLIANVVLVLLLFRRAFRGPEDDDMIARQRRQTGVLTSNLPPPQLRASGRSKNTEFADNDRALLAIPAVQAALAKGRKIEAIRVVREQTGMGLKEAKQAVERMRSDL